MLELPTLKDGMGDGQEGASTSHRAEKRVRTDGPCPSLLLDQESLEVRVTRA